MSVFFIFLMFVVNWDVIKVKIFLFIFKLVFNVVVFFFKIFILCFNLGICMFMDRLVLKCVVKCGMIFVNCEVGLLDVIMICLLFKYR